MKRLMFIAAVLPLLGFLPAEDDMQFTDWSVPENMGLKVNSDYYDACPTISKSGLSLYFRSDRPDPNAQGGFDIYVSQRDSLEDPWEAPVNLGPTINGPSDELDTAFSTDGHWMIFVSNRQGCGGLDMWISHRKDKRNDFGWEDPANLGCIINSAAMDIGPSLFNDDITGQTLLYFSSNRPGGTGLLDIYVVAFSDDTGMLGLPIPVAGLNTVRNDYEAALRKDGLEIIFARGQPGWGPDLWVSTRESTLDPWGMPVNLTAINSTSYDFRPTLSWDGTTLIFASERVSKMSEVTSDLFMCTRTKLHPSIGSAGSILPAQPRPSMISCR